MNTKKGTDAKTGDTNGTNILHQASQKSDKLKKVSQSLGKSLL